MPALENEDKFQEFRRLGATGANLKLRAQEVLRKRCDMCVCAVGLNEPNTTLPALAWLPGMLPACVQRVTARAGP